MRWFLIAKLLMKVRLLSALLQSILGTKFELIFKLNYYKLCFLMFCTYFYDLDSEIQMPVLKNIKNDLFILLLIDNSSYSAIYEANVTQDNHSLT